MKTISFTPQNIEKIKKGLKTQTRRTRYYDLFPGDVVQIEEDKSVTLLVTKISGGKLKEISNEDAVKEGYANSAEFLKGDWATSELQKQENPKVWVYDFIRYVDKQDEYFK